MKMTHLQTFNNGAVMNRVFHSPSCNAVINFCPVDNLFQSNVYVKDNQAFIYYRGDIVKGTITVDNNDNITFNIKN